MGGEHKKENTIGGHWMSVSHTSVSYIEHK